MQKLVLEDESKAVFNHACTFLDEAVNQRLQAATKQQRQSASPSGSRSGQANGAESGNGRKMPAWMTGISTPLQLRSQPQYDSALELQVASRSVSHALPAEDVICGGAGTHSLRWAFSSSDLPVLMQAGSHAVHSVGEMQQRVGFPSDEFYRDDEAMSDTTQRYACSDTTQRYPCSDEDAMSDATKCYAEADPPAIYAPPPLTCFQSRARCRALGGCMSPCTVAFGFCINRQLVPAERFFPSDLFVDIFCSYGGLQA